MTPADWVMLGVLALVCLAAIVGPTPPPSGPFDPWGYQ